MLVVDAGALFDVVAHAPCADAIRDLMAADTDLAAPRLIDAEVFSTMRTPAAGRRGPEPTR